MSFQPTFHPDVATLWLPDFYQFHDGLAVRALEGVLTKTGFETLAPGERVKGFGKRGEVKKGQLGAQGIQG